MSGACASKTAALAVALGLSLVLGRATPAIAHARGIISDSCQSCHSGGDGPPALSLTSDPAIFNPGQLVTFTLVIRASSVKVGGAFITTGAVGALAPLAGEGLQINGQALTHSSPKAAVNGAVTFRFTWQAPTKPGGLDVLVAALAGNGDNSPSGDSPGSRDFQWAFGCSAQTFYVDLDRDGYGNKSLGTRLGCAGDAAPAGFAITDGDCDENDETVHPGATELCNRKDDNCDSQIDEGSLPINMWPDHDGDGYYGAQVGTPKLGCGNVVGYATQAGDCDDTDPAIHPNAAEICNMRDDDCDGDVDELVRPRCGVGWCARLSSSCSAADCRPGPPRAETCNAFDDDCDGAIDNDACPTGYTCAGNACVASDGAGGTAGAATAGGGGPASGGQALPGDTGGQMENDTSRESGCAIAVSGRPAAELGRFDRGCFALFVSAGCLAVRTVRRKKRRK